MSELDLDLFWLLLDMGKLEEIRNIVPANFDWSVLHPKHKTTILLMAVLNCDRCSVSKTELDNIEWMIRCGASPSQQSGGNSTSCCTVSPYRKPDAGITIPYRGHSCVSFIRAFREEIRSKQKVQEWEQREQFLEEATCRIARAACQRQTRPRASVVYAMLVVAKG